ncbi:MAG TPA: DUF3052 domain-containing protein, partial [Phycisphaerae bacterium]|nr:DUF3052 domain-containing protein [Phycisphaerae bacterium]
RVLLHAAPDGFDRTLEPLPDGVRVQPNLRSPGPFDVAIGFVLSQRRLDLDLPKLKERLATDGGLWIAWPKKASGVKTDVSETEVRRAGLATGLVDNKICAVDETWSALRFVYRLADRIRT